jgi:hypothetical protein
VRDAAGEADDVIVISSLGVPRRGRRRRSRRAHDAEPEPEPLPATRVTVVRATPFGDEDDAARWLDRMRAEVDARDTFAEDSLRLLNRTIHAHRAATMDPYVNEQGPHDPVAVRVGFGDGQALADGNWTEAVDSPPDPGRRQRRVDALRPQERVAAVLGGRERVDACETLVLRARLDLDHGRRREAALQLEAAAVAMLAELGNEEDPDQRDDLASLGERADALAAARNEAVTGDLSEGSAEAVRESLELAERVLRRRRILGGRGESG